MFVIFMILEHLIYMYTYIILWCFCRKLCIKTGQLARFADGSAVVQVMYKFVCFHNLM